MGVGWWQPHREDVWSVMGGVDTVLLNTQRNGGLHGDNGEIEERTTSQEEEDLEDEEEEEVELTRLKELVPSVSVKDNVSQLDVILEAIRYIASLQGRLRDRIDSGEIVPVMVPLEEHLG